MLAAVSAGSVITPFPTTGRPVATSRNAIVPVLAVTIRKLSGLNVLHEAPIYAPVNPLLGGPNFIGGGMVATISIIPRTSPLRDTASFFPSRDSVWQAAQRAS